jgi:hypothetical protein
VGAGRRTSQGSGAKQRHGGDGCGPDVKISLSVEGGQNSPV